jgi:hypothetical protein
VQVTQVTQPSSWQKRFQQFTSEQLDLLPHRETSKA